MSIHDCCGTTCKRDADVFERAINEVEYVCTHSMREYANTLRAGINNSEAELNGVSNNMTNLTRLSLEDTILQAFQTTDDLKLFYETYADCLDEGGMNMLLGIIEISCARQNKVMGTFEEMIKEVGSERC